MYLQTGTAAGELLGVEQQQCERAKETEGNENKMAHETRFATPT